MISPPKPRPHPKPKQRLSKRNKVTIALGILSAGGMVVAADRQETAGITKSNQGKVSAAWKLGRGCIVLSGAGDGPHIDALMQEFRDWFTSSETALKHADIDAEIRRRHG